jgi:predicted esterase
MKKYFPNAISIECKSPENVKYLASSGFSLDSQDKNYAELKGLYGDELAIVTYANTIKEESSIAHKAGRSAELIMYNMIASDILFLVKDTFPQFKEMTYLGVSAGGAVITKLVSFIGSASARLILQAPDYPLDACLPQHKPLGNLVLDKILLMWDLDDQKIPINRKDAVHQDLAKHAKRIDFAATSKGHMFDASVLRVICQDKI